jgi:Transglycosylase SLT domain
MAKQQGFSDEEIKRMKKLLRQSNSGKSKGKKFSDDFFEAGEFGEISKEKAMKARAEGAGIFKALGVYAETLKKERTVRTGLKTMKGDLLRRAGYPTLGFLTEVLFDQKASIEEREDLAKQLGYKLKKKDAEKKKDKEGKEQEEDKLKGRYKISPDSVEKAQSLIQTIHQDISEIKERISPKKITAKSGDQSKELIYNPLTGDFFYASNLEKMSDDSKLKKSAIKKIAYELNKVRVEEEKKKKFVDPKELDPFAQSKNPLTILRNEMNEKFDEVFKLLKKKGKGGGDSLTQDLLEALLGGASGGVLANVLKAAIPAALTFIGRASLIGLFTAALAAAINKSNTYSRETSEKAQENIFDNVDLNDPEAVKQERERYANLEITKLGTGVSDMTQEDITAEREKAKKQFDVLLNAERERRKQVADERAKTARENQNPVMVAQQTAPVLARSNFEAVESVNQLEKDLRPEEQAEFKKVLDDTWRVWTGSLDSSVLNGDIKVGGKEVSRSYVSMKILEDMGLTKATNDVDGAPRERNVRPERLLPQTERGKRRRELWGKAYNEYKEMSEKERAQPGTLQRGTYLPSWQPSEAQGVTGTPVDAAPVSTAQAPPPPTPRPADGTGSVYRAPEGYTPPPGPGDMGPLNRLPVPTGTGSLGRPLPAAEKAETVQYRTAGNERVQSIEVPGITYRQLIRKAAEDTGVDEGFMLAMAKSESSMDPGAIAYKRDPVTKKILLDENNNPIPVGTARGLYQITKPSWEGEGGNPGISGLLKSSGFGNLSERDRTDPVANVYGAALLAREHAQKLKAKNIEPTVANLYTMHVLGEGLGIKLLSSPEKEKVAQPRGKPPIERDITVDKVLPNEVINDNPGLFLEGDKPITVAQAKQKLGAKTAMAPVYRELAKSDEWLTSDKLAPSSFNVNPDTTQAASDKLAVNPVATSERMRTRSPYSDQNMQTTNQQSILNQPTTNQQSTQNQSTNQQSTLTQPTTNLQSTQNQPQTTNQQLTQSVTNQQLTQNQPQTNNQRSTQDQSVTNQQSTLNQPQTTNLTLNQPTTNQPTTNQQLTQNRSTNRQSTLTLTQPQTTNLTLNQPTTQQSTLNQPQTAYYVPESRSGDLLDGGSREVAQENQRVASILAPVVINNQSRQSPSFLRNSMMGSPTNNGQIRNDDNTFLRSMARDFNHPTSYTVGNVV